MGRGSVRTGAKRSSPKANAMKVRGGWQEGQIQKGPPVSEPCQRSDQRQILEPHQRSPPGTYSAWKARTGSTLVARRAGTKTAKKATSPNPMAAARKAGR
jgi:hypothetical protein